jgi:pimeloyl-ACP methyl ester carboxylesterase
MTDAGPVPRRGPGPAFFRRRGFIVAVVTLLVAAAAAIYLITALQNFLTFPRAHPSVQQLSALAAAGGEALWFDIDGARVEAWSLPAHRPLAALVLESTFISIAGMVRDAGVPDWLVVNRFDTGAVLAKYSGPVLILHGTRDGTFPEAHAHALHAAARHPELHLGVCGHNDCPQQWDLVRSFLARNGVFNEPGSGDSP